MASLTLLINHEDVPLETSHFLPKGSALWVSLKGFVKLIPGLDFTPKATLTLSQDEWQKDPFGWGDHVLGQRRDFSSGGQGSRDGEFGDQGQPSLGVNSPCWVSS